MALSDLAVRQAKATGKAYTLPDLDGLSLAVTAAGGRTWHFRYYWAGKQKRMSLGTYPEVTLREARSLRDEARALLAKGTNPRAISIHRLAITRVSMPSCAGPLPWPIPCSMPGSPTPGRRAANCRPTTPAGWAAFST